MQYLETRTYKKKAVLPWYDSDTGNMVFFIIFTLVFGFGLIGLLVAINTPEYNEFQKAPITICVLSGILMGTSLIRIIGGIFKSKRSQGMY